MMDKWLLCDGRELSISDYPDLFAMVGFSFGGSAESKAFKLPGEPFTKPRPPIPHGSSWMVPKIKATSDGRLPAGVIMMVGENYNG